MERLVALGGRRNLVHVHHAHRRLDDEPEADLLLAADGGLDLRCQRVHGIYVLGVTDHGDDEHVGALSALLQDVDHILVGVVAVQTVDADCHRLRTEIDLLQSLDHVRARLVLQVLCDGVLEVHHDDVRGRLGCLRDQLRLGARHVHLAAVQALPDHRHRGEARPGTSSGQPHGLQARQPARHAPQACAAEGPLGAHGPHRVCRGGPVSTLEGQEGKNARG
mmetsp:Transcript_29450/g.84113  ORF Transcript_29450/g.84113 Transcript_29450/m.84113 type:complete len:221 (-) Transcript_29450:30-692(-)